jgi:DNA-binding response OmpR family regulator
MTNNSHKTSPSILVVDDEDYVTDMISDALEFEGFVTYKAYDGREGLSLARANPVDMVITDLMMPHLDGKRLVDMLSGIEHTRNIPILIISAGAYPGIGSSNVSFLSKPFEIQTVLNFVKGIMFTGGNIY